MSSYGSNSSGHLHARYQQPPYPTTPGPISHPQPSPYFPPQPSSHQTNHYNASAPPPFVSSSPTTQHMMPQPRARRSSSHSQHRPSYDQGRTSYEHAHGPSMAIPIRQPNPAEYQPHHPLPSYPPHAPPPTSYPAGPVFAQHAPVYARTSSHHSHYSHDPHAYADGEDKYEDMHDVERIDEAREREYEKRYAQKKAIERRPTLGDSLVSAMDKLGSVLGRKRQ